MLNEIYFEDDEFISLANTFIGQTYEEFILSF